MKNRLLMLILGCLCSMAQAQLSDVTQPGDTIVATSGNSPGSEGVTNAIDNADTKYLNFDITNTGFTVTPSIGLTVVKGLSLTSANDAPDRDPMTYLLEGSYDGENFVEISSGGVADFPTRFHTNYIFFDNAVPYASYRLIFPTVDNSTCCMQIAEVELLGAQAPGDVTQPGDALIATSGNSPGSEGVGNVIDNADTKYLNFDISNTGFTVSPSVGMTVVTGLSLKSANDAPDRDPMTYLLEGSYDGENFTEISSGDVADFPTRFHTNYIFFENSTPYPTYRLLFPTVDNSTCCMQIAEVEFLGSQAAGDVTQPGDEIIATSGNSPGSEGVTNAIDNADTKYLNFDISNTGFTVFPSVGLTIVNGISLKSANDAPDRDPMTYLLEGTYDGENFVEISSGDVADFPTRFHTNYVFFDNGVAYSGYRLLFPTVDNSTCCMQIAEVELLGVQLPGDATQPGDAIIATSGNSPGSEGVGNVIDNADTKYLNFDITNTGFTVTPSVGLTEIIGMSLKSANDAPDRDPMTYVLEGSYDGENFTEISSGDVADFPTRFHTNYIFFENTTPYLTYRLIFPTVDNSTCCMQIAEVELFPRPGGSCADYNIVPGGLITQQPTDTPVLAGSTAAINVIPSGPWNVQWLKKAPGEEAFVEVEGGTSATLEVKNASADMDGTIYQALVSTSDCDAELSQEIVLNIFAPSATTSVGFAWRGGGANGAPTNMGPEDIAGAHAQAYWNNLDGGSGDSGIGVFDPETGASEGIAVDSNNADTNVGIEFTTSGTWGAGTRTSNPTGRMLNGYVRTYGDYEADTSSEMIIYGLPAGTHSLLIYTVQAPLEFYDLDIEVEDANGSHWRYSRPQNSDEFNPSPNYVVVTAESASDRSIGNMLRFDNLKPINGEVIVRGYTPSGNNVGPGVNGIQVLLNTENVDALPSITANPVSTNGVIGGGLELSVGVSGDNLQIQWYRNGKAIEGANSATFIIGELSAEDAGAYSVAISNSAGRIASKNAVVDVLSSADISEGLVVHLPFDGNANDAAGGSNGQAKNGAGYGSGKIGQALELDGSDDWVYVPSYAKVSGALTVSAWANSSDGFFGPIVRNWIQELGDGRFGQFMLDIPFPDDAFGPIATGRLSVGPNEPVATHGLSTSLGGEWHHIAMTANGRTVSLYWNGELVAASDYLNNINDPAINWLAIGADVALATDADGNLDTSSEPEIRADSYPFRGSIDDVAIWNRSLSGAEIAALVAGGNAGQNAASVDPVLSTEPNPNAPKPAVLVAEGSASEPSVVDFGSLEGSASYAFYFTAIKAGASTAIAGDDAFAIKLDQWNEQGLFGTTQFGVADNLFSAVNGQNVASVFDAPVHVVLVSDAGAGSTDLYINGVLSGNWGGSIPLSGQVKVMGARLEQATDHMGEGSAMHAWATYTGKLTASEVQDLYNNRPAIAEPPVEPTVAIISLDGVPASGSGLDGRYWQAEPKGVGSLAEVGQGIIDNTRPVGVFTATGLTYQGGNDITPIREWLGADGDSYVGGEGDMNDGVLSFTGYVRIDSAGEVAIRSESDDGSKIWIGGELVVDNDGSHGAPGPNPDGSYNFTAPGLYPIEIQWFNGNWTNASGDHGGANLRVLAGGADIPGAILYNASDVAAASIAVSSAADEVGDAGLHAAYWTTEPKGLEFGEGGQGPIFSFLPGDDHGLAMMETSPQGRFISTNVSYSGNDLSPIVEWLGDDGASFVGTPGNLDDGLIQFKGYIAIDEAGLHTFSSSSDDGSVVYIGNQVVVNNDGGHGAPGPAPDGSAFFATPGLYPIEVAYFNGDWTNAGGDHGGANIDLTMDGASLAGSIFQPVGGLPALGGGANIAFVSFHETDEGSAAVAEAGMTEAADIGYTDALKAAGHTVTRVLTSGTPDVDALNGYDLVIISRSVSSGGYSSGANADAWNSITSPMLVLGGYVLRNNRMGYTDGSTMVDTVGNIQLKAEDASHPIFNGVDLTDGVTGDFAGIVTWNDQVQRHHRRQLRW
ncbi:MAG: hypothetical protein EBU26_07465 [Verrucomicrobia bacterium]|nr:hypothetical protein [Verrucomicrobiota bacterium]